MAYTALLPPSTEAPEWRQVPSCGCSSQSADTSTPGWLMNAQGTIKPPQLSQHSCALWHGCKNPVAQRGHKLCMAVRAAGSGIIKGPSTLDKANTWDKQKGRDDAENSHCNVLSSSVWVKAGNVQFPFSEDRARKVARSQDYCNWTDCTQLTSFIKICRQI